MLSGKRCCLKEFKCELKKKLSITISPSKPNVNFLSTTKILNDCFSFKEHGSAARSTRLTYWDQEKIVYFLRQMSPLSQSRRKRLGGTPYHADCGKFAVPRRTSLEDNAQFLAVGNAASRQSVKESCYMKINENQNNWHADPTLALQTRWTLRFQMEGVIGCFTFPEPHKKKLGLLKVTSNKSFTELINETLKPNTTLV